MFKAIISTSLLMISLQTFSFIEKDLFYTEKVIWKSVLTGITPSLIKGAPGVRTLLFQTKRYCYFYKIPLKRGSGEFFAQKMKNCQWDPNKREMSIISHIDYLKMGLDLEKGVLSIEYEKGELKKKRLVYLPNLKKKKDFKRFDTNPFKQVIPGVRFFQKGKVRESLIGGVSDSYPDKKFHFCHRFNAKCEEVLSNKCDECRYGHYEVVDYSCPNGVSKICGRGECGKKGWPACPRGREHLRKNEQGEICRAKSPYGLCHEGLDSLCDHNNILICG